MLENELTYDVLHHLFSYLDLDTAKSLRLVISSTKSQAYQFIIRRLLKDALLEIKFGDERFNVVARQIGGNFLCLGGFDTKTSRPYRDWREANGRFNYEKRWKLFAGLFGSIICGKVICDHLHLVDCTDLSDGELHVPFAQWAPVVKSVHPITCMFICGGQQFYPTFHDLELLFCTKLPRDIDLTVREVEGIDLYSRLSQLARAFVDSGHDVNATIIFQCGPNLGRHYIVIKTQESSFRKYLPKAHVTFQQECQKKESFWWSNMFGECQVIVETVMALRLVNSKNKTLIVNVYGPQNCCKYE